MIKKLRVPVYLMLDNDNAGEEATFRNGEILEKANIDLKVVRLIDYKDPDEFIINKGIEELLKFLKKHHECKAFFCIFFKYFCNSLSQA